MQHCCKSGATAALTMWTVTLHSQLIPRHSPAKRTACSRQACVDSLFDGVLDSAAHTSLRARAGTSEGVTTTRFAPGCQATMAICFWMVFTSGGSSGFVLYVKVTTPSASKLSCLVQSCGSQVLS